MVQPAPLAERRLLRAGLAFIWLATGLLVVSPYYRAVGEDHLGRLGLPVWVMVATCVGEVLLGLAVLFAPMTTWFAGVQVTMIAGFTVILAVLEPALLAHPFGLLSKNVPLAGTVLALWCIDREGWSPRARRWLTAGLAVFWVWEGLLPNVLFQGPTQTELFASVGLPEGLGRAMLTGTGVAMVLSAPALFLLRGRPLRLLLAAQMLLVLGVCAAVTWHDVRLWLHPFGPLTKNVSLLFATGALLVAAEKE